MYIYVTTTRCPLRDQLYSVSRPATLGRGLSYFFGIDWFIPLSRSAPGQGRAMGGTTNLQLL